ncbi:hypothetical protein B9N43_09935 [Denitratisoma sp. DHT3]|uniref:crotonase/enoyl-CoA hydratase family protein n=1 Tax=Denitratisoma sp. DHT3 TaxID=1981880 RepID=UPI001198B035|nr:crotonase/enoyl-CoA hydratase family protein [Denitratisoma sp. DHT3]QDX81537.1 hypothetical protein B9N43_09935 [Denitratisoma sp. DHT3]
MSDELIRIAEQDGIAIITLNRPAKRNALTLAMYERLGEYFAAPPPSVRVAILTAAGEHFCAGGDLGEHQEKNPIDVLHTSRRRQAIFDRIQYSGIPLVAVLKGAVLGGGLELALTAHVRVAEATAWFQLPEAAHGLFMGCGSTVRLGRILGPDRMAEMMLTRRIYNAGEAVGLGLAHYGVAADAGLAKARELAVTIAANTTTANWFITNALPRIDSMASADGLFAESLAIGLIQSDPETRRRMEDFMQKRKK